LAIVEKIAREHGGSVSCVSDVTTEHPNGFVEFWVELPSGGEMRDAREQVNEHSFVK
jgi:signal transduction histidine kinase